MRRGSLSLSLLSFLFFFLIPLNPFYRSFFSYWSLEYLFLDHAKFASLIIRLSIQKSKEGEASVE